MENLCVKLETAKRLRELWFKKESIFQYFSQHDWFNLWQYDKEDKVNTLYNAYTAQELLDNMPEKMEQYYLCYSKIWWLWYEAFNNWQYVSSLTQENFVNKNLAEALGQMMIYLIENDYYNPCK